MAATQQEASSDTDYPQHVPNWYDGSTLSIAALGTRKKCPHGCERGKKNKKNKRKRKKYARLRNVAQNILQVQAYKAVVTQDLKQEGKNNIEPD